MRKATLYARVSTEAQQKEGTIESQVAELRNQIAATGDVLVKEYIDNGFSGSRLDRPALDQLRQDLKTDSFEVIYFLNTDRIARDVAYQNLIIAEILKYKKQVIINGTDYVHNPENKFRLTVLGAVAELERAKIIERSVRGKLHHLRKGLPLSNGYNTYGYTYVRRTPTSPGAYVINEKEAEIVRFIFKQYAREKLGWAKIIRRLEDMGVLTKTGKKLWDVGKVKTILQNHSYAGTKYFNTRSLVKEPNHPLRGIKYGKKVFKDKSEWIGVKVPVIVPPALFDAAQARIEDSKRRYRNPRETRLLSNLVRCGVCGSAFTAYQRYCRKYRKINGRSVPVGIHHKIAYKCSRRIHQRMHSKNTDIVRCNNPEIVAYRLELSVFKTIQEAMADPAKFKKYLQFEREASFFTPQKIEKKLRNADQTLQRLMEQKRGVVTLYAAGEITRDEYAQKCLYFDAEISKTKAVKTELLKQISTIHTDDAVETNLRQYCESVKVRLDQCRAFEDRRKFLLETLDKIVYRNRQIILSGSIPLQLKTSADRADAGGRITFDIVGAIGS